MFLLEVNGPESDVVPIYPQSQSLFFETTPQDFLIKEGSQSYIRVLNITVRQTQKKIAWLMQLSKLKSGHIRQINNFGQISLNRKRDLDKGLPKPESAESCSMVEK